MGATARDQALAFCLKQHIRVRTEPGEPSQPQLRDGIELVCLSALSSMRSVLRLEQGALDVLETEVSELSQIEEVKFDLPSLVRDLAIVDEATEILRAILGVDGVPVAEALRSCNRSDPNEVLGRVRKVLEEQGWTER